MKVQILLENLETRTITNMREKIENCADTIIDNINTIQYVYDEFGHDLEVHQAEKISNIVYQQIKLRM